MANEPTRSHARQPEIGAPTTTSNTPACSEPGWRRTRASRGAPVVVVRPLREDAWRPLGSRVRTTWLHARSPRRSAPGAAPAGFASSHRPLRAPRQRRAGGSKHLSGACEIPQPTSDEAGHTMKKVVARALAAREHPVPETPGAGARAHRVPNTARKDPRYLTSLRCPHRRAPRSRVSHEC